MSVDGHVPPSTSVPTPPPSTSVSTSDGSDGEAKGMSRSPSSNVVTSMSGVHNPKPQPNYPPTSAQEGTIGDRICLVMVGLPATGKTYIARRLRQYLRFFHGAVTEVFNVGNYRRKLHGANMPADFYDPDNAVGAAKRKECAKAAMADMKKWLVAGNELGRVAIFDATNTTRQRRAWVLDQVSEVLESKSHVIFIESVCDDTVMVEANIRATKVKMPDYAQVDEQAAIHDFKERINHYRGVYEPIDTTGRLHPPDKRLSWVRLADCGHSVAMNRISGFLQGRIVQFLIAMHPNTTPGMRPRSLYLTRHGQSEYNVLRKIGGDAGLSEMGEQYALALARFVHKQVLGFSEDGSIPDDQFQSKENNWIAETAPSSASEVSPRAAAALTDPPRSHTRLFTSSLRRTRDTARHIRHPKLPSGWICMRPRVWRNLDEIYAGVFDGMTYEEIKAAAPEEFAARTADKLGYRYPRGESYLDVINRVESIVHELERQQDDVVVVGHQGILRIIYAYFMNLDREKAPFVSIPLNTVIKITPSGAYECEEERIVLLSGPDAPSH